MKGGPRLQSSCRVDRAVVATAHPELVLARSRRLASLERRYREHAATFPREWLDYGADDPLECLRWINPCVACSSVPEPVAAGRVFVVRCACGAKALGARMRWQAILNWNKSPLAVHPPWDSLPFFFLGGLDLQAARAKLGALREHLELRANLAGMQRVMGLGVGSRFLQRLKAYLGWCIYAQSLVGRAGADAEAQKR